MKIDRKTYAASQLGNTVAGIGLDVPCRLPDVTINSEGKSFLVEVPRF